MRHQQITRTQSGRMCARLNLHLPICTVEILLRVDAKFPLNEWDRLIPQATLTLNLLSQSNVSPNVSAYAHHHGQFNYNHMPLAPMGCAVQLHEKPKKQKTFGEHAADEWYIKTLPEHYRCHIIFVQKT
ncbi:hypothetical protein ACHAW6_008259 [Cyclotella cf. meneghiniana]